MCLLATRRWKKRDFTLFRGKKKKKIVMLQPKPVAGENTDGSCNLLPRFWFPFCLFTTSWTFSRLLDARKLISATLFKLFLHFFLFEHAHYSRPDVSVSADWSLLTAKKYPGDSSQLCTFICACMKIWSHCLYQPFGKSNVSVFLLPLGSLFLSLLLASAANEQITQ